MNAYVKPTSGEDTESDERRPSGTSACAIHGIAFVAWLGCPECDPDEVPPPSALDFPGCVPCSMWEAAGASWPRPCVRHYAGERAL